MSPKPHWLKQEPWSLGGDKATAREPAACQQLAAVGSEGAGRQPGRTGLAAARGGQGARAAGSLGKVLVLTAS